MIRLWKDTKRCPYVFSDPEYAGWIARDDKRLAEIDEYRKELLITAHQYISHEDRSIRNMAHFIIGILDEKQKDR